MQEEEGQEEEEEEEEAEEELDVYGYSVRTQAHATGPY